MKKCLTPFWRFIKGPDPFFYSLNWKNFVRAFL